MFSTLARKINELTNETDNRKSLDVAIETANELITLLNPQAIDLKNGEDALDENIPVNKFPNYKAESWFAQHPYFSGERVALNFYESDAVQIKFYWLGDTATKARVSAGVMLTPNWEDSDLTRNDQYKVGIDFFLSANTKSLLMVVSNNGNLRILEFNDHLSNTQQDILQNLRGVLTLDSKEQIHKTMWDSLALSEVNKKFYLGIAEKFNELLNHLVADGKDAEDSKLFASRLLGRLLFVWFLRRKNIIQEQYGYFVIDSSDSTEYYDLKLKKLFFETLNTPASDRQHADSKTPYLNGGLFEAHDNDWAHQKVSFPTGFFNRLYEHLKQYNFTTDESSPEYEQVAIDPEMLGRVFESLLATQVTETGDQARKAKGAFYTPREIVAYMCKESLRQYIYTKLDNEIQNEGVDKLLDISDSEWELQHTNAKRNLWGEKDRNTVPAQVLQALDDLKVLDPACGSGAFPMGMLQLMLKTYERLDGRFDAYRTKLRIVQDNIYGVDIEPMAVEISRLRAWLSLVVDDEDDNNVEPLPNLDFKFVCANSLLPLEQQTGLFADTTLHEKLAEVRTKFFNARVPSSKDKWKAEYYKLTGNGQHSFLGDQRESQLKSFDPFKNSRPAEFFNADYMFGIPKFDLVIGNPPYVEHKKLKSISKSLKKNYEVYTGSSDLSVYFFEHAINLLKTHGVLSYINTNKFFNTEYGSKLRSFLLNKNILSLVNFEQVPVFENVLVSSCVVLVENSQPSNDTIRYKLIYRDKEWRVAFLNRPFENYPKSYLQGTEWAFKSDADIELKSKLENGATKLADLPGVNIRRGVTTGFDPAFMVHSDIKQREGFRDSKIIKPLLKGEHIKRYRVKSSDLWLINSHNGLRRTGLPRIDLPKDYPEIYQYILKIDEDNNHKVKSRSDQGDAWYNLRNCAFLDEFDQPKIIWPLTADKWGFAYDDQKHYLASGSFMLTSTNTNLMFLLGLVNSKLMQYYFMHTGVMTAGGAYTLKKATIERLPVRGGTETSDIARLARDISDDRIANPEANTASQESQIDRLVYGLYGLTSEEISLVESSC